MAIIGAFVAFAIVGGYLLGLLERVLQRRRARKAVIERRLHQCRAINK